MAMADADTQQTEVAGQGVLLSERPRLTPKMLKIAELIGDEGLSNRLVAERLGVTSGYINLRTREIAARLPDQFNTPRETIIRWWLTTDPANPAKD